MFPRGRKILLGVSGGISAYKSCDLLRRLQDNGFVVDVVPTQASLNFVGKSTWEALSGRKVHLDLWSDVEKVPHISMAKENDLIVIAPATADLLAKLATGRSDDLLTNIVLASTAPKVLVPAMHTEMWLNPATTENVDTLRRRGFIVVEPDEGRMTGTDVGVGRYPESTKIIKAINDALVATSNTDLPSIEGITITNVETAEQMLAVLDFEFPHCDALIMSAAVADARIVNYSDIKIGKESLSTLSLVNNPDILKSLASVKKPGQIIVGFAAETISDIKELEASASAKLSSKSLDLIYVNNVSKGAVFGSEKTKGLIIDKNQNVIEVPEISKDTLSDILLDQLVSKLG